MSQPIRTPAEHRAIVAEIMAKAPANDNEIFGRRPRIGTPKHAALSRQLAGLQAWRALNDATPTWLMPSPANDLKPLEEGPPAVDASGKARPSPDFLLEACEGVGFAMRGGRLVPVDGDIERCPETGHIVRLGRLQLSNGRRAEPARRKTIDGGSKPYQARTFAGAVLAYLPDGRDPADPRNHKRWRRPKEEPERAKGQDGLDEEDLAASNAYYEWMLGIDRPDTGVMPRATGEYARGFLQGRVHGRDDSRPAAEDPVERESVRRYVAERLTTDEMAVLDAAMSAGTFADIGRATGCTNQKAAERAGKRALLLVAERLAEIFSAA